MTVSISFLDNVPISILIRLTGGFRGYRERCYEHWTDGKTGTVIEPCVLLNLINHAYTNVTRRKALNLQFFHFNYYLTISILLNGKDWRGVGEPRKIVGRT